VTYGLSQVIATGASVEQGKPTSYREALAQDYTQKWGEAIHAELRSRQLNETWERIPEGSIARNAKMIGCKWVFKTKMNSDG
jgi:hypothetical protein